MTKEERMIFNNTLLSSYATLCYASRSMGFVITDLFEGKRPSQIVSPRQRQRLAERRDALSSARQTILAACSVHGFLLSWIKSTVGEVKFLELLANLPTGITTTADKLMAYADKTARAMSLSEPEEEDIIDSLATEILTDLDNPAARGVQHNLRQIKGG